MTDLDDDTIPLIERYREVGIHDGQPRSRIENVVKPAIDHVFSLSDLAELAAFAAYIANPPEARLLAAAKVAASFQLAVEERRARPEIDLDAVTASVAGLQSRRLRRRDRFCSVICVPAAPGAPDAAVRVPPLP